MNENNKTESELILQSNNKIINSYYQSKIDLDSNSYSEDENSISYSSFKDQNKEDIYNSIKVFCKFRPNLNLNHGNSFIEYISNKEILINSSYSQGNYSVLYKFDGVFKHTDNQEYIFKSSCIDILESVLDGHNGSIIAYGQTGSGKTYTMTGGISIEEGIIQQSLKYIFNKIKNESIVKISIAEIYNEKVNDLIDLSNINLLIKKDLSNSIIIDNLSEYQVKNYDEVYEYIKKISKNRKTTSTILNDQSSRSHCLIIFNIIQENTFSKLIFVDLAGSERIGKSGIKELNIEETKNINKSLSNLGLVINCLSNKECNYIPYRDSKLTRILSDSIGGNSKTNIILTCSMDSSNELETVSTLRFGIRAKEVKNNCVINYNSYKKDEDSLYRTIELLKLRINDKDKLIKDLKTKLNHKNKQNEETEVSSIFKLNKMNIQPIKSNTIVNLQYLALKCINQTQFEILSKDNYDYSLYNIKVKSNIKELGLYFMDEVEYKNYMKANLSTINNFNYSNDIAYSFKRNEKVYDFLLKTIHKKFSKFYNQTNNVQIKNEKITKIEKSIELSIINNENLYKKVEEYKKDLFLKEKTNFEKEKKVIFSILNEKTLKIEELKMKLNEKENYLNNKYEN